MGSPTAKTLERGSGGLHHSGRLLLWAHVEVAASGCRDRDVAHDGVPVVGPPVRWLDGVAGGGGGTCFLLDRRRRKIGSWPGAVAGSEK